MCAGELEVELAQRSNANAMKIAMPMKSATGMNVDRR